MDRPPQRIKGCFLNTHLSMQSSMSVRSEMMCRVPPHSPPLFRQGQTFHIPAKIRQVYEPFKDHPGISDADPDIPASTSKYNINKYTHQWITLDHDHTVYMNYTPPPPNPPFQRNSMRPLQGHHNFFFKKTRKDGFWLETQNHQQGKSLMKVIIRQCSGVQHTTDCSHFPQHAASSKALFCNTDVYDYVLHDMELEC